MPSPDDKKPSRDGYFIIERSVVAMSLGVGATFDPAASRAAIFSAAVPFPPAMIAPACPMRFPSGAVASCTTTYGAPMEGLFRVHGSKGWLEVNQAFVYEGLHLHGEFSGTKLDEPNPARDPSQFQAEAEHFSHCIQNGLEPTSPGEEGLRDMRYITQIYKESGISI